MTIVKSMGFIFSSDHAMLFAEKMMDMGNLIAGGLIIGQFLPGVSFNFVLAFSGSIGFLTFYVIAQIVIRKGEGKNAK